ncbi:hypothetical protein ACFVT1_05915 [Streptomyces sp. NPDC057963]
MTDPARAEIGPSASFITGRSVHVDGGRCCTETANNQGKSTT